MLGDPQTVMAKSMATSSAGARMVVAQDASGLDPVRVALVGQLAAGLLANPNILKGAGWQGFVNRESRGMADNILRDMQGGA